MRDLLHGSLHGLAFGVPHSADPGIEWRKLGRSDSDVAWIVSLVICRDIIRERREKAKPLFGDTF